jgi:DNA-binding transcriptional LysR family regulator
MDLADLRIFKTVVEEGGITAAARRLHRVHSNVACRTDSLHAIS